MKASAKLVAAVMVILVANGCGSKKTRNTDGPSEYGPQPPGVDVGSRASSETAGPMGPEAPLGPQPSADFSPPKDGYVLVLGPGLARSLAYIGVLHELERRQVPVRAIVGVEMGAVIGGIWASSNLNNLEWEMHKFKKHTLLDKPMLGLGDKVAEGRKLHVFLRKALKADVLQKMKVPVIVASATREGGDLIFENTGSAHEIIRGAMGIPGVIRSHVFEGKDRITAAIESPFPVEQGKKLGLGDTICVNVIGRGESVAAKDSAEEQLATLMRSVATTAKSQLRDCDGVITVPVEGIGYLDFEQKADLIYRGKAAAQRWLDDAK